MRNLRKKHRAAAVSMLALALGAGACGDINVPDYNRESISNLLNAPNRTRIDAATDGLLQNSRRDVAGRVRLTGIVGREAYYLDPNEQRYVSELVTGNIDPSSFAGNHDYSNPYGTIAQGQMILAALEKVAADQYTAAQKEAIRGFVLTIMGSDMLVVAQLHQYGPTEVNADPLAAPSPMKTQAQLYARAAQYLDEAVPHLKAGGSAFTFPLPSGFTIGGSFTSPTNFIKFNRALRVRLDVLTQNYAAALVHLDSTFIATPTSPTRATFNQGVYYTFSSASGDLSNGLSSGSPELADTLLKTNAQLKVGGGRDDRYTLKVDSGSTVNRYSIKTFLRFRAYRVAGAQYAGANSGASSPVPWIRNEELILDRAEARWFTGDKVGAMADLNYVRTNSGGLAPVATPATDAGFVDLLLYEREYSLLYEGGHRWMDLRRFNRLNTLVNYPRTGDKSITYFPVPFTECLARGGAGSDLGC
ncbi:MAG TPA: RagB/SusD family nutrient uptake outer membrane protein [Longimicrobium sp.]|nr:RagB/SusD family nutrient uptake outer membrane protein [Longimicrobium sp.]